MTSFGCLASTARPIYSQGRLFGPLLFSLYINDILADDTVIYLEGSNINYLQDTINNTLDKTYLWLRFNKLKLKINETKFIGKNKYLRILLSAKRY